MTRQTNPVIPSVTHRRASVLFKITWHFSKYKYSTKYELAAIIDHYMLSHNFPLLRSSILILVNVAKSHIYFKVV